MPRSCRWVARSSAGPARDVTIVAWSRMVADGPRRRRTMLAADGIEAEVVDLRCAGCRSTSTRVVASVRPHRAAGGRPRGRRPPAASAARSRRASRRPPSTSSRAGGARRARRSSRPRSARISRRASCPMRAAIIAAVRRTWSRVGRRSAPPSRAPDRRPDAAATSPADELVAQLRTMLRIRRFEEALIRLAETTRHRPLPRLRRPGGDRRARAGAPARRATSPTRRTATTATSSRAAWIRRRCSRRSWARRPAQPGQGRHAPPRLGRPRLPHHLLVRGRAAADRGRLRVRVPAAGPGPRERRAVRRRRAGGGRLARGGEHRRDARAAGHLPVREQLRSRRSARRRTSTPAPRSPRSS